MLRKTQLTPSQQGHAAELRTCFDFAARGYSAALSPFPGSPFDVLVDLGDGGIVTVQVKSTSRVKRVRREDGRLRSKYAFVMNGAGKYRKAAVDLYAFVVFDAAETWAMYVSPSEMRGDYPSTKLFGAATFADRAKDSLDRFLFERMAR